MEYVEVIVQKVNMCSVTKLRKEAVVEKLVGGENLQIWFQTIRLK